MSDAAIAVPLAPAKGEVDPAFANLYAARFGEMVRLASAVSGGAANAEDVVQDAFAHLLLRWRRVEDPLPYLRRSVVNGCIGRFRRSRREDLVAEPADGLAPAADDGPELAQLVAALPPRQRAAVVLRFTFRWSERETAAALGCRPGTVGSLVHRGLAALRTQLEEDHGAR